MKIHKKVFWLNFAVLFIVALNLRGPMTTIAPLVGEIQNFYGLNAALAGSLSTIPLIAFGSISFLVIYLPPVRAMFMGLILIFMGELIRSYTGFYGLFVGTALMGSGIAIGNVLLPSFVKGRFPRQIPQMMGMYSFSLGVSGILGISMAAPLFSLFSLPGALACWAWVAFLAILIYLPQVANRRLYRPIIKNIHSSQLFSSATAWKVACFMASQAFISYSIFAWYPSIIAQKGYDIAYGSNMLLLSQIISIPISLMCPIFLGKLKEAYRMPYILSLCLLYILACCMILQVESKAMIVLNTILFAIPMGGVFGIFLLLISMKSHNMMIAAKLSAMAQGCGYLFAAPAPVVLGWLRDLQGHFDGGILIMIFTCVCLAIFGVLAYKSAVIK